MRTCSCWVWRADLRHCTQTSFTAEMLVQGVPGHLIPGTHADSICQPGSASLSLSHLTFLQMRPLFGLVWSLAFSSQSSVLTENNNKIEGSSAIECFPSMTQALGSIPSTDKWQRQAAETAQWLGAPVARPGFRSQHPQGSSQKYL